MCMALERYILEGRYKYQAYLSVRKENKESQGLSLPACRRVGIVNAFVRISVCQRRNLTGAVRFEAEPKLLARAG